MTPPTFGSIETGFGKAAGAEGIAPAALPGRAQETQMVSPLVAQYVAEIEAQPAMCLRLEPGGDGRSRLGGGPDTTLPWPRFEGRPLAFVAQLDLPQIQAVGGPDWLPATGRLLFFYAMDRGPWGAYASDRGSAIVLHEQAASGPATPPADLDPDLILQGYAVTPTQARSYSNEERLKLDCSEFDLESSHAFYDALIGLEPASPWHQIGGLPGAIQFDTMERECHAIWRELGNAGGDASDWRLLLQLDTDPNADMMWFDMGRLYFWVREQDARAGDFSNVWAILQSH